jgi:iron-sulfur cluster assembly protein/iron-sulfur cluster insertion protein
MQFENAAAQKHLRVLVEEGGCSGFRYGMTFDEPRSDDARFTSEGIDVVVDPASLERVRDITIDFDDGFSGKGFQISNPNARRTCGCGKSFR